MNEIMHCVWGAQFLECTIEAATSLDMYVNVCDILWWATGSGCWLGHPTLGLPTHWDPKTRGFVL